MKNITRILTRFSAVLVGLVFLFSGFVKGVDPMGSAYKFSDYFNAFNLGFLTPLGIFLAFFMPAAEFLIGVSLLFRMRFRLGIWVVSIFMIFFTILTLILALTNPVTDCGCFGDAITLTNWQTFIKNLVLLPFIAWLFFSRKKAGNPWQEFTGWAGLAVFAVLFLVLEINAYRHLPMLDFRPYSVGTYIPDKMYVPEGAPMDEYQTFLYYEKDGVVKEFTEDNFPWQDSTWSFVDSENKLISKGYATPIHDFTVSDEYGNDHTTEILENPGYSFLMISTGLGKADKDALLYTNDLASWAYARDFGFYFMSSSTEQEIEAAVNELGLETDIYTTDEITLKTIVRSNPGLLLLKEGTILAKWHHNDFPSLEELESGLLSTTLTRYRKAIETRSTLIFLSLFLLLSVLLIYLPGLRKQ